MNTEQISSFTFPSINPQNEAKSDYSEDVINKFCQLISNSNHWNLGSVRFLATHLENFNIFVEEYPENDLIKISRCIVDKINCVRKAINKINESLANEDWKTSNESKTQEMESEKGKEIFKKLQEEAQKFNAIFITKFIGKSSSQPIEILMCLNHQMEKWS
jgi:hypothetical protein